MKTAALFLLLVIVAMSTHSQDAKKIGIQIGNNPAAGKYFTTNSTRIYYEVYGEGQPILILHGNGGSIENSASLVPVLSKKFKVIAVDNRCHGKSDCPPGYLKYEQMASDINLLLNSLHIDSVYIYGHSDGAIIGILMAVNYPSKVKKLLAVGANLRPDSTAIVSDAIDALKMLLKQEKDSTELKRMILISDQPHIPDSLLHRINTDVLVMAGDRDFIRNEHTLEIFNNIPGALLCILPGTTHFIAEQRPVWFNEIMLDFFENPPARTTSLEMYMQGKK